MLKEYNLAGKVAITQDFTTRDKFKFDNTRVTEKWRTSYLSCPSPKIV